MSHLQNITKGENNIESVQKFTYLGSLVIIINNISEEVEKRIDIANRKYNGLIEDIRSDNITRKTKFQIYKIPK